MAKQYAFITDHAAKTVVSVFNGQFEIRTAADNPEAKTRINRAGKAIHFIPAKSVSGSIVDVTVEALEFGKVLNIHMEHRGEAFVVSLPMDGSLARGFLGCVENIDLAKPVQMDVATYDRDGKPRQYLFVKQDKKNVPPRYTKDNPGDKPEWKPVLVNGQTIYDKTAETEYFERVLEEHIRPVLTSATTRLMAVDDEYIITASVEPEPPAGAEDDLPF